MLFGAERQLHIFKVNAQVPVERKCANCSSVEEATQDFTFGRAMPLNVADNRLQASVSEDIADVLQDVSFGRAAPFKFAKA